MDKTLHKKLTENHLYAYASLALTDRDDMLADMKQEMKILHAAAQDLLQPRPEAIAGILKRARAL